MITSLAAFWPHPLGDLAQSICPSVHLVRVKVAVQVEGYRD
ncbi:MAG: hypothetical protein ACRDWG_04970 [Actinomycetes bacterium]